MVLGLLALLHAILLSGCDLRLIGTGISASDMQVLQTVVKPACDVEWKEIVSDLPATPYRASSLAELAPNLHFGLDIAARSQSKARWPLGNVCAPVRVIRDRDIEAALKLETSVPPTWEHFHGRFPGVRTLVRVSLPVYSKDGRRAVVYTEGTCPYRCGNGFFHELVRNSSGWRISRSVNAWAL